MVRAGERAGQHVGNFGSLVTGAEVATRPAVPFELNVSVPLVVEYEAVAKRCAREIGLSIADIDDVLDYLCSVAQHRQIFYLWRPVLADPRDDLVLELAVEANVEYIVTHNLRDFGEAIRFGVQPIAPQDFLRRLRSRI